MASGRLSIPWAGTTPPGALARVRPALPAGVQSRLQAHEAKALAAVPAVHVLARLRVRDQLATVGTRSDRRHVLLLSNGFGIGHRQDVAQVLFECRVAHVALFPVHPATETESILDRSNRFITDKFHL